MSAWLCENKTLSLVVDIIKSSEFKDKYDLDGSSDMDEETLMMKLSRMNSKSLNYRYGHEKDNYLKDIKYVKQLVVPAQKHKSVCCYLYQTCEDPEVKETPLFRALDKWSEDHYEDFTEQEKDNCHWDIDHPLPKRRTVQ